jgi:hypothetical protein
VLPLVDLLLVEDPNQQLSFGWMDVWELNPEIGSLWLKAFMIGCGRAVPLFI